MPGILGTIQIEELEAVHADSGDVGRIGEKLTVRTDLEMEDINCPVCEASKGEPLHLEGSFQMVRCPACQFIFLNPRPTSNALLSFYQHYLPEEESSVECWEEMMKSVFHRAATLLEPFRREGKLLDVGTGFGFFLKEMKERGWDAVGVEISQKAIDYARDVLGLTVYPGPAEKVGFPDNYFDAVTAFYVIEHLPNPLAFLRECHRILKPGGILLLRYPHTTPIKNFLRFLRIKNRLYDLPAHLSDFSPGMIQQCLEKIGFRKCKHLIGGYTQPDDPGKRVAGVLFGSLSETFFRLSLGKFLFPGVSKTVMASKE